MKSGFARSAAALCALALVFTACATAQENPKTTIGAMGGAAGGGLIAAAAGGGPAAIAGGVILGGLLGGAVGNALDQRDKELAMKQAQYSLENSQTGQASAWQNPDTGNSGTFTPTRTYQTETGQPCREYTQEIMVGGEKHQSYGTACRQADGSWRIVN
jgi:surface antigen